MWHDSVKTIGVELKFKEGPLNMEPSVYKPSQAQKHLLMIGEHLSRG